MGSLAVAAWLGGGVPAVAAQSDPIAIDRDVGDRVVLPARQDAAVTGTSTLQPNTDFLVRVVSQSSPAFERETGTVVEDDGTWTATLDLSVAVDGQPITVEIVFNTDVVASVPGVVGPLTASVRFDDQALPADESQVVIAGVRLEVGGFVVVTDGGGTMRGVSGYLDGATTYSNLAVTLDPPVAGTEQLVATAWLDVDGTRRFDARADRPYPDGDPASDAAIVQVPTPVPEPTAAPVTETTVAPDTETPPPPGSGEGLDVLVSLAGGVLGVAGLRRAGRRLRTEIRKRRAGGNRPPVAHFVSVPDRPRPGVPVLFDGSLSFDPDPDDAVERYEWSIGGTGARGPRRVHTFGTADEYDVELRVVDDSGAVGLHVETVSVETRSGRLELAGVHPAELRDEFLTFRNAGDAALELGGWTVHEATETPDGLDAGPRSYTVPDGFALPAGESVSVHTGTASADRDGTGSVEHHLYWGATASIWDVRAGGLVVADADGYPVFGARYERTAAGDYAVERVEAAALEDWFESVSVDETVRIPVLGVTVGPAIGVGAVENGIEFVASCLFLRGAGAFAAAWAHLTAFLVLFLVTWLVSTGYGIRPSIDVGGPLLALVGAVAVTTAGGVAAALGWGFRRLADRLS
jgi:hypothetical protein